MKFNYDEASPITGNKSVVVAGESKLCLESGYELFLGQTFEGVPEVILDTKFEDETSQVWFKTLRFSPNSILYPVNDEWEVNSFRDWNDETDNDLQVQRTKKNIIGKEIIEVLDPNTSVSFPTFLEAFDEFNRRANQEI